MKAFEWNLDKAEEIRSTRGVSFQEVIFHILHGGLLDVMEHPNKAKYPNQKIFAVNIEDYVYLIPFVEEENTVFLKTIIPSRKMTKKYLGGRSK